MNSEEVFLVGLPGPSHHYAGLAMGNLASIASANKASNPRDCALQSLAMMRKLLALGVKQIIVPPQLRPNLLWLRQQGFSGTDAGVIDQAFKKSPQLLMASYAAADMWLANSGVITASQDSIDGKVHVSPANLVGEMHRCHEAEKHLKIFQTIFANKEFFTVHEPLAAVASCGDEGAANHMRLRDCDANYCVNIFVFGNALSGKNTPKKYPARQYERASRAIADRHQLQRVQFLQQTPDAIDLGVFHNDVIALSNANWLICHELAYMDQIEELQALCANVKVVEASQLTLDEAIKNYFFNGLLLDTRQGLQLLLPEQCCGSKSVQNLLLTLPLTEIDYLNCEQSMMNGGGPACLRLRAWLTKEQQAAINSDYWLDEAKLEQMTQWVLSTYRDRLVPKDLTDPQFMDEIYTQRAALSKILPLCAIDPPL